MGLRNKLGHIDTARVQWCATFANILPAGGKTYLGEQELVWDWVGLVCRDMTRA